jgi:hypothetical protein
MKIGKMGQPILSIETLASRMKSLIEVNDHGGAYLLAAKGLGCTDLVERFERINRRQLELGHLPPDLEEDRRRACESLKVFAKKKLGTVGAQELRL